MKKVSHLRGWFAGSLVISLFAFFGGGSSSVAYAASTDFTQCQNDPSNTNAKQPCVWSSGALNQNNSFYNEGNAIPQRLFQIIASAGTHTIRFSYDFSKSSIHAYDFLMKPDYTQAGSLLNPCADLPSFVSTSTCDGLFVGKKIVDIASDLFDSVPTHEYDQVLRKLFFGCTNCTGTPVVTIVGHTPSTSCTTTCGDSSVAVDVTFTTSGSNAIVAMWFGGHLAQGPDTSGATGWGVGQGASSISGAPFHISLASLDGSSLGSRDNAISPGALVDLCSGLICESNNTCEAATCVNGACVFTPLTNGTACDDGNACTQTDTCQGGVCVGSNPVTCSGGDQCNSGGVCDPTTGACTAGTPVQNGTPCNDGDACTQTDTCQNGFCIGTNPVVCSDGDQCHDPSVCNIQTGLCGPNPAKPNNTPCNDGNACTQTDTCQNGTCVGSNPVTCTASDQCHIAGTCNPSTGQCSNPNAPNGTLCVGSSNGGVCDAQDTCQGGVCIDNFKPSNVQCRASAGVCDRAEFCTGTSGACPADGFLLGTVCRAAAGACDVAEFCNGSGPNCPADAVKAPGTLCRASVGACDMPEYCNGTSPSCPADSLVAAGTICRDGDGLCNPAEQCTGDSGLCPGDITFLPNPETCNLPPLGICRTAGFWGTHGGTEKTGKNAAINITQAVIDFAVQNSGPLQICGEKIINTAVNDAASALEAVCVAVQGDQRLQLARQLTAASLNCSVSGFFNCAGSALFQDVFNFCNTTCTGSTSAAEISACTNALDCLNNGGTLLAGGFCKTGTCSDNPNAACNAGDLSNCGAGASCVPDVQTCHDQPLCLEVGGVPVGPCFNETGPAGSTNACNTASKTACTVIMPGEAACGTDSKP